MGRGHNRAAGRHRCEQQMGFDLAYQPIPQKRVGGLAAPFKVHATRGLGGWECDKGRYKVNIGT